MAGGSPVTANDILSNKGDSAFAGGLGQSGTQNYINGVWKMEDAIGDTMKLLQAQQIVKNKQIYDKKLKDRNDFADMLASKELSTTEMDDEDRLAQAKEVKSYKDELVSKFKQGNLSDEDFLALKQKYGDLRDRGVRAKTNYAAIKADMDAMGDPYDKSAGYVKTISKATTGEDGVQQTITEQEKTPNVRANDENKTGLQKHIDAFKEEKKKNPNAMYKPYVPVLETKDEDVFLPPVTKTTVEKIPGSMKVQKTTVQDIPQTFNQFAKAGLDANKNTAMKKKWDQILSDVANGGIAGKEMIESSNSEWDKINTERGYQIGDPGYLQIKPDTPYLQGLAMISIAQQHAQKFKGQPSIKSEEYANATDAKLAEKQFDLQKDITLEGVKTKNTLAEINARTAGTIATQNNSGKNAIALETLRQKKKSGSGGGSGASGSQSDDVYYQDGLGKVKRIDEKAKVLNSDEMEAKFNKNKGMGKSGIKIEEVKSLKEVNPAALDPKLKSYFTKSPSLYVVEKKNGEIVYVDVDGNKYSTDDLAEVAAGSSKGAKKEFLERKRNNPPKTEYEPAAPKKKRKVIINADGTTSFQ